MMKIKIRKKWLLVQPQLKLNKRRKPLLTKRESGTISMVPITKKMGRKSSQMANLLTALTNSSTLGIRRKMMLKTSKQVKWLQLGSSLRWMLKLKRLLPKRLLKSPNASGDGINSMVLFTRMMVLEVSQMDLQSTELTMMLSLKTIIIIKIRSTNHSFKK